MEKHREKYIKGVRTLKLSKLIVIIVVKALSCKLLC